MEGTARVSPNAARTSPPPVTSRTSGPAAPAIRSTAQTGGDPRGHRQPSHPSIAVAVAVSGLRPGESARSKGLDQDHVRVLASADGPLPPICVHRATMRVIDGAHRLAAARLLGRTTIDVVFFDGTAEEAFRQGVLENTAHGLPLSLADRRAAAVRIIRSDPRLSDRAVARSAGLSHKTVAALRSGFAAQTPGQVSESRVGADGRTRPLDATTGRLAAGRIIAERPDATLREIAREAGISLGTARDVRARMLTGEGPVPAARFPAQPQSAPIDLDEAIGSLSRDPVLRYSQAGRTLLRLLTARTLTIEQWRDSSSAVPAHCHTAIARVARECARTWSTIADELEAA